MHDFKLGLMVCSVRFDEHNHKLKCATAAKALDKATEEVKKAEKHLNDVISEETRHCLNTSNLVCVKIKAWAMRFNEECPMQELWVLPTLRNLLTYLNLNLL